MVLTYIGVKAFRKLKRRNKFQNYRDLFLLFF